MSHRVTKREHTGKAKARLRMIQHYEQVTWNVSRTCRFFGISRTQFYIWHKRYRQAGLAGLRRTWPRTPSSTSLRPPRPRLKFPLALRLQQFALPQGRAMPGRFRSRGGSLKYLIS